MKIYIVVVEDRNSDVEVKPFVSKEKAIAIAKVDALGSCRSADDYEELDLGKEDGWVFYAQYSVEGDSVRVVETELVDAKST